jgi:two-component system cell cycle response regulator
MKSKRVLIVDNDNSMRQIIKDSLAGQFDVIEAKHGHEAVRFADSKKPNLILLDIELPGLSGIEVCKRLKATSHTKNIPVILISSHSRKEQIIVGLQAGADDYLTKPFSPQEVLSRVNAHLNYEMFYQDLEKGDLQLLLGLYDSISVLRNPVKILNMVVKKVADIIGVDRCSIVGINDKNEFTVKASNDLDMQEEIKLDLDRYPEIQKAHETRQAVVVNDATKDPLMEPVRSQMEKRGLNSIFVIPIIKKDSVIGTLFLGTATKLQGGISDRVYQLCHLVANISANVLENAILFESMKTAKGIFEDLEIRDGLTRLHSHRFFYDKLEKEFARTTRYKTPLSLIFIDIDDFRKINDTYGHLRGDEVLKKIAVVIRDIVRDIDVAARYGGGEFSVLLPNTAAEGALTLAKRINSLISELKIAEEGKGQVTVSMGLSSCEGDQNYPFDQMVKHAEQAMEKAKDAGKNQIMVYDHH